MIKKKCNEVKVQLKRFLGFGSSVVNQELIESIRLVLNDFNDIIILLVFGTCWEIWWEHELEGILFVF